nr:hypothetical protein MACL_00002716 [Theileria orientalis]
MFLSFTSNVSFKAYLAAIRESRGLQTGETTDQTLTVTVTANSID